MGSTRLSGQFGHRRRCRFVQISKWFDFLSWSRQAQLFETNGERRAMQMEKSPSNSLQSVLSAESSLSDCNFFIIMYEIYILL